MTTLRYRKGNGNRNKSRKRQVKGGAPHSISQLLSMPPSELMAVWPSVNKVTKEKLKGSLYHINRHLNQQEFFWFHQRSIDVQSVGKEGDGESGNPTVTYRLNGRLHRDNGPAMVDLVTQSEVWYQHGKIHRDDGPASIDKLKHIDIWSQHGEMHRDDGPAFIDNNNQVETWYLHGETHRDNGPAHINKLNQVEVWYQRGKMHRDDGPAYIDKLNQVEVWCQRGKMHRDNGPAYIDRKNNIEKWYHHDKEVDPPTVVEPNTASEKNRHCAYPGCTISGVGDEYTWKCAKCKSVYYCSKDHQEAHWPEHKSICKQLRKHVSQTPI